MFAFFSSLPYAAFSPPPSPPFVIPRISPFVSLFFAFFPPFYGLPNTGLDSRAPMELRLVRKKEEKKNNENENREAQRRSMFV